MTLVETYTEMKNTANDLKNTRLIIQYLSEPEGRGYVDARILSSDTIRASIQVTSELSKESLKTAMLVYEKSLYTHMCELTEQMKQLSNSEVDQ